MLRILSVKTQRLTVVLGVFLQCFYDFRTPDKICQSNFNEPCGRALECDKTQRKEQKAMLLGIRWEKMRWLKLCPRTDRPWPLVILNSIRSPIFRCFGKFGMNGRGHSPPRMEIHRRYLIHTNQPKTENHNHDLSKLFSNTSRTAVFSLCQNSDSLLSNRMEMPFVPLTPRVPPSSGN